MLQKDKQGVPLKDAEGRPRPLSSHTLVPVRAVSRSVLHPRTFVWQIQQRFGRCVCSKRHQDAALATWQLPLLGWNTHSESSSSAMHDSACMKGSL